MADEGKGYSDLAIAFIAALMLLAYAPLLASLSFLGGLAAPAMALVVLLLGIGIAVKTKPTMKLGTLGRYLIALGLATTGANVLLPAVPAMGWAVALGLVALLLPYLKGVPVVGGYVAKVA